MRENVLKKIAKALYLRPGTIRRVACGPLRGCRFRVNEVTGLSPWYSGPERAHQTTFRNKVAPGDWVVDVGANWGLHTLYLSKLVGRDGRVIALEPFERAFRELDWHIRANRCKNVTALRLGLADDTRIASFIRGESACTGYITRKRSDGVDGSIAVQVTTLDSLMEDLNWPLVSLVKMDVEGSESRVLSGSVETVKRHRPYFVIDLHTPEQDLAVAHRLVEWGYKLARLEGPPIEHTDRCWPDPRGVWGSIIAEPFATPRCS